MSTETRNPYDDWMAGVAAKEREELTRIQILMQEAVNNCALRKLDSECYASRQTLKQLKIIADAIQYETPFA